MSGVALGRRFGAGCGSFRVRRRKPWPLEPGQWWRWRFWRLWRGGCFDPHASQQVLAYAVMGLRDETRSVFLLRSIHVLDHGQIAGCLGLTLPAVQAHMAAALREIVRTVDFIERVRPRHREAAFARSDEA